VPAKGRLPHDLPTTSARLLREVCVRRQTADWGLLSFGGDGTHFRAKDVAVVEPKARGGLEPFEDGARIGGCPGKQGIQREPTEAGHLPFPSGHLRTQRCQGSVNSSTLDRQGSIMIHSAFRPTLAALRCQLLVGLGVAGGSFSI